MTILIDDYCGASELERLCRLFFPDEKITVAKSIPEADELNATVGVEEAYGQHYAAASLVFGEYSKQKKRQLNEEELKSDDERELILAQCLYELLCDLTSYQPPWGMLTGVRPVKLLRMLLDEGGEEHARNVMVEKFHCSEEKYKLSLQTMEAEHKIINSSSPESFSLYISIPFCPTRCSYCSFVSQSIEKAQKLLPEYVDLLIKEIESTAELTAELGLKLETVYMGGGTPTTLNAQQLDRVLGAVNRCFDMSSVREFTVEAGRPDTVTTEKLVAIKENGAGRISINPQTLNDQVLENIGRRHSAAQVYQAMELAHQVGFDCINMDIIAGLPGDDAASFNATLDGVFSMHPENITVHTLSMKRAATLVTSGCIRPDAFNNPAASMLDACSLRLPQEGYQPYYLYRQTRMLGNMENVGWTKPGYDGLYNVYIMDETHTILAVGAGGVTKLRQPGVNNISRVYNYKFPYEYINSFSTILERKNEVRSFYEKFC